MTTRRLAVIAVMLAVGIGVMFLLPKSSAQPTGLQLNNDGKPFLPEKVGNWSGTELEITAKEINTLGEGTQFARKRFTNPLQPNRAIESTIVLSGRDIANSLHRPERCLGAQGWEILASDVVAVGVKGQPVGGVLDETSTTLGSFDVRRLRIRKSIKVADSAQMRVIDAYDYYWLIGEHHITASHFDRFFSDNRDRLFRGVDQRWAYVSMIVPIPYHPDPQIQRQIGEAVDEDSKGFISNLAPSIHSSSIEYN